MDVFSIVAVVLILLILFVLMIAVAKLYAVGVALFGTEKQGRPTGKQSPLQRIFNRLPKGYKTQSTTVKPKDYSE